MARDPLTSIGETLMGTLDAARERLPDFSLMEDVEVPVYVIHTGPSPEDYELLCDFEKFMTESQSGLLKRPVLRIWAGRSDFERYMFARHLREAFSAQFDRARVALRAAQESDRGWSFPSVGQLMFWMVTEAGALAGTLLLYLAIAVGGTAVGDFLRRMTAIFKSRKDDPEAAQNDLEALIEEKKSVIDAALSRIEISLHRDLYLHAWRGQRPGPVTGMDREAWPLPDFVRERMND
ncbi:MAG: hypothetical protein AAF439_12365 [Pseudomonadota bacterium]